MIPDMKLLLRTQEELFSDVELMAIGYRIETN